MNFVKNICNTTLKLTNNSPYLTFVRFRYYADKIASGGFIRRYGYNEKIIQSGLLPHKDNGRKIPIPAYRCVFFLRFMTFHQIKRNFTILQTKERILRKTSVIGTK